MENNYKKKMYLCLVGALLLLIGYGTGRYVVPDRVVIQTKVQEVEKAIVVEKVRTEVQVVKVAETKQRLHREETDYKHANGDEEKRVTEDSNIDSVIHEQDTKYVDRDVIKEVEKRVEVIKEKFVERDRPNWRLGGLVGYNFATLKTNALDMDGVVFGAEVQRRIAGPISIGAFGLSTGTGGLSLNLEF